MEIIDKLKRCAKAGLGYIKTLSNIQEAEIFVADNEQFTARVNFTSHIPCSGIQEPKSSASCGVGVRVVFEKDGKVMIGEGSEDRNISLEGVKLAVAKAMKNAVQDPSFRTLPRPVGEEPSLFNYHDPRVLAISSDDFVKMAEAVQEGALEEFSQRGFSSVDNLIIGGDVTIINEQVAVANTHGIDESDVSTILMANITVMIESRNAKGTGWASGTSLGNFNAKEAGRMAARSAMSTISGQKIRSGKYNVVLGPQPVCVIVSNLIASALSLGSFCMNTSPFCGQFGEIVLSKDLSIYDHGALPGAMASKRITCEGLPTGKVMLVDGGRLVGLLANTYWVNHPQNKFGVAVARNGFRFGGGGRHHRVMPGVDATNLVVEGVNPMSSQELIGLVGDGIYIGRLWYLYPINLGSGDFTGTIVADSYIIKDGKIQEPLLPNKVRLNDNWIRLFKDCVMGVSNKAVPTLVWAAEEMVVAPEIAIKDMSLEEIDLLLEG